MIRPATPADAEVLAALQVRAWHRAYADFVEPERFDTVDERVVRWREFLAEPPESRRETLVFDQDGQLAGFASVGPARDADLAADVGELAALYVDPPAQGAGVGGALLTAAEARLEAMGFTSAALWVFTENGYARAVYERRGWHEDGPAASAAAHGENWWAPAVRYRRALQPTAVPAPPEAN